MRVALIDLEAQHAALLPELRDAFERVTATARFVGGPEVEGFETELDFLADVNRGLTLEGLRLIWEKNRR